jgi:putative ABC transport system permease protein
MTAFALAFAYLKRRWGQALLSILVGALGIAAVSTALFGFDALPDAAERSWGGVDLVVGPKGSALDLVLCCALHVSDPSGLVSEKAAMAIAHHPLVRVAAPIALGDNVEGWRIAGTTPQILSVYRATLAAGGGWTKPWKRCWGRKLRSHCTTSSATGSSAHTDWAAVAKCMRSFPTPWSAYLRRRDRRSTGWSCAT